MIDLYSSSLEIFKQLSISFCFAVNEFFLTYFPSILVTSIFDNSPKIELNVNVDFFLINSEQWKVIKLLIMLEIKVINVLLSNTPSL
ncbi:hypothetical protein NWE61_02190 [Mycoplasmopsis felis]|uniref:hypothetical protein n=1 Tax=Mycoplasmopsis felis TaxID=33923 RepID=UPI0021DF45C6|nr:hypothetical protein [Mycoplasmopsis felis]MCU9933999.1 hypothetical protein [Mycoplasmopsis felis]WQQ06867.1 hypothetical protein RRG37_03355 [Mycoplasmopsis felis]